MNYLSYFLDHFCLIYVQRNLDKYNMQNDMKTMNKTGAYNYNTNTLVKRMVHTKYG